MEATPDARPAATILFAEDESSVLRVATWRLELDGYRVLAARDGAEALELFRERAAEVDLVVVDLRMPRMGGCEALRQILGLRPDVPAILTTAGDPPEEIPGLPPGARLSLFPKPYDLDRLAEQVRTSLVAA